LGLILVVTRHSVYKSYRDNINACILLTRTVLYISHTLDSRTLVLSKIFAPAHEVTTLSIYAPDLGLMKLAHVLLLAVLTFCWIWLLPLMILGFVFSVPAIVVSLPVCVVISITLQWWQHGKIMATHPIRKLLSEIPWHEWFPCNTLSINKTSVVAVHPHGLLCCGALVGIHFVPGSQTVFCVAPLLFYIPVLGWFIRVLGCIPAKRDIMLSCLQQGCSVIVVPGGVPELVMAEQRNDKKWFQRSGFIRLANEAHVPIQTVFVHGECATYAMLEAPFLQTRVYWAWKTNVPLAFPAFMGWYGTWLPKRVPLTLTTRHIEAKNKAEYYSQLQQLSSINI